MIKILTYLFLSCKKATSLIEKKEINKLTPIEHLQLRVHTSMCEVCKKYEKQSATINHMVEKWVKTQHDQKIVLSDEIKQKIISEIENKKK